MAVENPLVRRVLAKSTLPCLPLPPNAMRQHIHTERLVLRPLDRNDFDGFRILRTQPEAMTGTTLGRVDRGIAETHAALDFFLPPNDSKAFLYGIFLATSGELVGEGGVHSMESSVSGWPEIGYKFKKEHWGHGYATEFLRGFLTAWWSLPRRTVEVNAHQSSIEFKGREIVQEQVFANTDIENTPSQRVLAKAGFRSFLEWTEPDTQEHRLGEPITLVGFILGRPAVGSGPSGE
jgi:RimJ/RimL family protein N-acetyltransferase